MAKLSNKGHEAFAQNLAKGMKQGEALVMAGYKANRGRASDLAKTPMVVDRVAEIKNEMNAKLFEVSKAKDAKDMAMKLDDLELSLTWVAEKLMLNAAAAADNGNYAASNQALIALQKIIEVRGNEDDPDSRAPEGMVSIDDMLKLLQGTTGMIQDIQKTAQTVTDITPTQTADADDFILALPDLAQFEEDTS